MIAHPGRGGAGIASAVLPMSNSSRFVGDTRGWLSFARLHPAEGHGDIAVLPDGPTCVVRWFPGWW